MKDNIIEPINDDLSENIIEYFDEIKSNELAIYRMLMMPKEMFNSVNLQNNDNRRNVFFSKKNC